MHKITLSLALLAVVLFAYDSSADESGKTPGRKPGAADKGARRNVERQARGPGVERDPAQMIARLMREFDKDGDQKLNSTELTALMTSIHDRRAAAGRGGEGQSRARQGRPGQGRPAQAQQGQQRKGEGKPGTERQRRRGPDEAVNPGGERPNRPSDQ